MSEIAEELTGEQKQHLAELLFVRLRDSEKFRMGVAIGLANKFTVAEYTLYLEEQVE